MGEIVTGYKAFESNLTCRGFQYEVGKTYEMDGDIALCERGFHFCRNLADCFEYYDRDSKVCAVEADGKIMHGTDKSVCNSITIVRELEPIEKNRIIYGNGDGYGYGYGNGDGDGYGYGYGNGDGNGYGNGYSNGDGDGNGDGYSNGDGDGYGYGNGYGNGYGYGKNGYRVFALGGKNE